MLVRKMLIKTRIFILIMLSGALIFFNIFLNIGDTFGPRVVLGAFCYNKPPYIFLFHQKHRLTPPTGVWKVNP